MWASICIALLVQPMLHMPLLGRPGSSLVDSTGSKRRSDNWCMYYIIIYNYICATGIFWSLLVWLCILERIGSLSSALRILGHRDLRPSWYVKCILFAQHFSAAFCTVSCGVWTSVCKRERRVMPRREEVLVHDLLWFLLFLLTWESN